MARAPGSPPPRRVAALVTGLVAACALCAARPALATTTVLCPASGFQQLTARVGTVTTGTGNYLTTQSCVTEIRSDGIGGQQARALANVTTAAPLYISLTFSRLNIECQWDYLWLAAGANATLAAPIAALTGEYVPAPITTNQTAVALTFFSDYYVTFTGFNLTYVISACPHNCANRGTCVRGVCECPSGFGGPYCQAEFCPADCSDKGQCVINGTFSGCVCDSGFVGNDCSIPTYSVRFQRLLPDAPVPVVSAHAVYASETDALYVFGGSTVDPKAPGNSLYRFNFTTLTWSRMPVVGASPPGRSGHASAVVDGQRMFVIGGQSATALLSDVWVYSVASRSWTLVTGAGAGPAPSTLMRGVYVAPLRSIVVYGGLSNDNTNTNELFAFNVDTYKWVFLPALRNGNTGPPRGLFGHSMVYDVAMNRLLVYGGQYYDVSTGAVFNFIVYSYSLLSGTWTALPVSSMQSLPATLFQRYLHSAVIVGDYMVVFGGSPYRPPSQNNDAMCFSDQLFAFHLTCYQWLSLPFAQTSTEPSLARYGHSLINRSNQLYLLGGYTGVFQSDFQVLVHDRCAWYSSEATCTVDPLCAWEDGDTWCRETVRATFPPGIDKTTYTYTWLNVTACPRCPRANTKADCSALDECLWCATNNTCVGTAPDERDAVAAACAFDTSDCVQDPATSSVVQLAQCQMCISQSNCSICADTQACFPNSAGRPSTCLVSRSLINACEDPCHAYAACGTCIASSSCGWCSISRVCTSTGSTCTEGIAPLALCPLSCTASVTQNTCTQGSRGCVWCPSLGQCLNGLLYPSTYAFGSCYGYTEAADEQPKTCFCNLHSKTCDSNNVCQACGNNTINGVQGQCEVCLPGFVGSAQIGGTCWYELPDGVNSIYSAIVQPDQFTYLRTGALYNSGTIIFQSLAGSIAVLYVSTSTQTPGPDNYGWVITAQTSGSGLQLTNLDGELFMGVTAAVSGPARFTITFYSDSSNGSQIQGINLLFYLIIFFMCFFGVLFVGIFMLKIRQFYRLRQPRFYRPTFDLSIMADMVRVRLFSGTPTTNLEKSVIALEKIPNSAFNVATVMVELPHSRTAPDGTEAGDSELEPAHLSLACAVVIDKTAVTDHPDLSPQFFFTQLDEAHARRIELPEPDINALRQQQQEMLLQRQRFALQHQLAQQRAQQQQQRQQPQAPAAAPSGRHARRSLHFGSRRTEPATSAVPAPPPQQQQRVQSMSLDPATL